MEIVDVIRAYEILKTHNLDISLVKEGANISRNGIDDRKGDNVVQNPNQSSLVGNMFKQFKIWTEQARVPDSVLAKVQTEKIYIEEEVRVLQEGKRISNGNIRNSGSDKI